jgi:SAM-dependent methyltransferase
MKKPGHFTKVTAAEGYISAFPQPNASELSQFYSELYYQKPQTTTYQQTYPPEELEQKRLRARLLMHALEQFHDKRARDTDFLEIGSGEGFVLKAATDADYQTKGIDFSSFGLSKFHPELMDRLDTGDAFDLLDRYIAKGGKTDICVLQNVLEHVIDPVGLMGRIKGMLSDGGLMAVTVPNDFSRLQQRASELRLIDDEYWFLPPQHLHYFNPASLETFLNSMGFEVLDAYGDFPIELFLFHPGSNYVRDPSAGPKAHAARVALDLLLAEKGMGLYHAFCKAMTGCGFGRNVTMIVRPKEAGQP